MSAVNISKSIFASKTFWANLFGVVASVSAVLAGVIPPAAGVLGAVSGIANIGLRLVTKQPVTVP